MIKKKLVLKKIKPTFTRLVTTADRYTFEDSITETGMVIPDMEGAIKDIQTVVAVGDGVREIKEGDKVSLNFKRFAQYKYSKNSAKADMEEYNNQIVSYAFTFVEIDGVDYLFLDNQDVEFIIKEYKEVEVALPDTITEAPKATNLVKPSTSTLIV